MSKHKTLNFEQALTQLEDIIQGIESGDVGLEASLDEYEKGMKLIASCKQILQKAEVKIAKLTTDADGQLQTKSA